MKVEVKEAQSNEVLQQGDYVTNLTEEQFDELVRIENDAYKLKYYDNETLIVSKEIQLMYYTELDLYEKKQKLPFEEFKQRAINTFKDGKEN